MGKQLTEADKQIFRTAISDQIGRLQIQTIDGDERRYHDDRVRYNQVIRNTLDKGFGSRWTPITTELDKLYDTVAARLTRTAATRDKAISNKNLKSQQAYETSVILLKANIHEYACALNQTLTYFDKSRDNLTAKTEIFREHNQQLEKATRQFVTEASTLKNLTDARVVSVDKATGERRAVRTGENYNNGPLPLFLKVIHEPYEARRNRRNAPNSQSPDRPTQIDFLKSISEANPSYDAMIGALLLVKHLIEESAPNRGQPLKLFCLPVSHGSDLLRIIDCRLKVEEARETYIERPHTYYQALKDACGHQVQHSNYSSALDTLISPELGTALS